MHSSAMPHRGEYCTIFAVASHRREERGAGCVLPPLPPFPSSSLLVFLMPELQNVREKIHAKPSRVEPNTPKHTHTHNTPLGGEDA